MSDVLQIFSGLCMLLGAFLFFASGVALWRMPDVYTRMHGPTKAASLGLAFLALGALIDDAVEGAGFWLEELLILLFVCLTVGLDGLDGLGWPRLASIGLVGLWPRLASIGLDWPRLASIGLARPPGSSQDSGPQPAVLALTRRRRSAPKGLRPFFWGPSDADG
jgi:multicomponent K+:H+ antiporter subunit G